MIVFAFGGATDGTGGAGHLGCDYVTGAAIEVCASFGNSARVSALFEAELSECSMNGNLCGLSTGEALSRWCAAVVGNNALSDFATAPTWDQDGEPDFVDQTDPTDQNPDSIGCGMAFLSWLMSQGFALNAIAPAMVALGDAGTLAQLYANLTGNPASSAFPNFIAAVQGLANGVASDDPFGGAAQLTQVAHGAPWTIAVASHVFASIMTDIASGKSADHVVANVRAIMSAAVPAPPAKGMATAAACTPGSRRLRPPAAPDRRPLFRAGVLARPLTAALESVPQAYAGLPL